MSESVSEENDRRSRRKAAALFCLLLLLPLFSLPGDDGGIESLPGSSGPHPSLAAWSVDFSEEQDVQELPRDLRRGACRTLSPVKQRPRLHSPLRSVLCTGPCAAAMTDRAAFCAPCGIPAEIPVFSALLADSLPVRAGPVVARPVSSLPALS